MMNDLLPDNINIGDSYTEKPVAKARAEILPKESSTGDISEYRNELKQTKEEAKKTKSMIRRIENITFLGFIIIIIMVTALIFSYIEFVYSGGKNDDYKYNLNEKVSNQEYNLKMLKLCLSSNKWLNPKCLEN